MEITLKFIEPGIANYFMAFMGGLIIIIAKFNQWKKNVDHIKHYTKLIQLLPEFEIWCYTHVTDWLLVVVLTPVLVSLQPAITYTWAMAYNYELTATEFLLYENTHLLISFAIGILTQTVGVLLIAATEFVYKKVKKILS